MCGILGWVGSDAALPGDDDFAAALDLIRHRGPDGGAAWQDQGVFFGHRRLSIVDLAERADQPMCIAHLVLVFNGEIYNHRALRLELETLGHVFVTSSDSEVLVRAWLQWERAALNRLEGMFAFALWDRQKRALTLVRDRYGEKPMFVHRRSDGLAFASELPPLVRLANGNLQEDEQALGLYFLLSYIPAPKSIFKDVIQLEPGSWLEWNAAQGVQQGRYYDLRNEVREGSSGVVSDYAQAVRQLKESLTQAVRLRVESADVPVATLLSGGIDSSVVTTIASQISSTALTAYSLGFPEAPDFDETDFAKSVIKGLPNVRHHIVEATEQSVLEFTPKVLDRLGEPFADASIIPTSMLSSQISEKVALGGDAADELFAGYGVYPAVVGGASLPDWLRRFLMLFPRHPNPHGIGNPRLRAIALFHKHLRGTALESYLSWRFYADKNGLDALNISINGDTIMRQFLDSASGKSLCDIQILDVIFNLPNDMLKKVDYAAMSEGLEIRLPFLDRGLVHWALSLPDEYKMQGSVRKRILRDAFADVLPQEILTRGKKGFLLPIRRWFRDGQMRAELHSMLVRQTRFDTKRCLALLQEHGEGRSDHSVLLWSIYVYLNWHQRLKSWGNNQFLLGFTKRRSEDGSCLIRYAR